MGSRPAEQFQTVQKSYGQRAAGLSGHGLRRGNTHGKIRKCLPLYLQPQLCFFIIARWDADRQGRRCRIGRTGEPEEAGKPGIFLSAGLRLPFFASEATRRGGLFFSARFFACLEEGRPSARASLSLCSFSLRHGLERMSEPENSVPISSGKRAWKIGNLFKRTYSGGMLLQIRSRELPGRCCDSRDIARMAPMSRIHEN